MLSLFWGGLFCSDISAMRPAQIEGRRDMLSNQIQLMNSTDILLNLLCVVLCELFWVDIFWYDLADDDEDYNLNRFCGDVKHFMQDEN